MGWQHSRVLAAGGDQIQKGLAMLHGIGRPSSSPAMKGDLLWREETQTPDGTMTILRPCAICQKHGVSVQKPDSALI